MHSPSASRSSYSRSSFAHGRKSAREPIRSKNRLRVSGMASWCSKFGKSHRKIYVPFLNWTMMLFTVSLTVHFGSSDRLVAAAGARYPLRWYWQQYFFTVLRCRPRQRSHRASSSLCRSIATRIVSTILKPCLLKPCLLKPCLS